MGCNTNKSPDRNVNHCNRYNPSVADGGTNSSLNMGGDLSSVNQGVPYTFAKYNPVGRDTSQEEEPNVPDFTRDLVMYGNELCEADDGQVQNICGTNSGNCGKLMVEVGQGSNGTIYSILDHYPEKLSFWPGAGDEWFMYLWDLSNPVAGYPCHWIEDIDGTTTTTDDEGNTSSTTSAWGSACHPCKSFSCDPGASTVTYTTPDGPMTEGRDPFPTLWTAGTRTNAIAYRYEGGIPTTIPEGPIDFTITPTSGSPTDAWDGSSTNGIPIQCPENPWSDPDDIGAEFVEVFDSLNSNTGTGLRVKIRYGPTSSGDPATITGTTIYIDELMNSGVNYQVGDSFNLQIANTGGNINFTLTVSAVGPVETSNPYSDYALLNAADTVNGHIIEKVKHMDLNFNYHIAELSGDGNDFAKDTVYTTSRGNQIRVLAGFGIRDRAFFGGLYEFRQKSFQFMTADLERQPNTFDDFRQPTAVRFVDVNVTPGSSTVTLVNASDTEWIDVGYNFRSAYFPTDCYITNVSGTSFTINQVAQGVGGGSTDPVRTRCEITNIKIVNGQITYIKIADGGSGWNKLNSNPVVHLVHGEKKGLAAEFSTAFTNGVLTSISVDFKGSMYAAGAQIDIAVPMTDKLVAQKEYAATSNYDDDPNNEALKAAIESDQVKSTSYKGTKIFVDTVTESGLSAKDYNYEGGLIDTFEKYQRIMQRAAADVPDGLNRLYFATELTQYDLDRGMRNHEYEDVTVNRRKGELRDLKRLPNVIRTERVYRALPDREDFEDLNEQTLDERLPQALRDGGYGSEAGNMQDFVDNDKIARDERYDLHSEPVEVSTSGKKLNKFPKEEVRTVKGTFYDLPCASKYTKYLLRQYIPDPRVSVNLNVTLSWEPLVAKGCGDEQQSGCFGTSGAPADTGNITYSSNFSGPYGPGCKSWSASGTYKIYNDLTNSGYLFGVSCDKFGNPFDFKCT